MNKIMPYKGAWNDDNFMKTYIENLIKEISLENFNETYLRENGYFNVLSAIRRTKFKAWKTYPELPRFNSLMHDKNYYKNFDNVKKEIDYLIKKYNCIPPLEILQIEKMGSLLAQTNKYYGGIKNVLKTLNIKNTIKESKLETCVKRILDKFVLDSIYIDNGHKILLNYGIDFQNPETKQFFELDRFYINERVGIEIHGQQHYKKGGKSSHWNNPKRFKRILEIDNIKKEILKKCNVYLIEIPYNKCSEASIKQQLIDSNKFKI